MHTRGERFYVHGTDLYLQLLVSIKRIDADIGSFYLKFNKPIQRQPKIVENEFQANASAVYRYKTEHGEKFGSVVETSKSLAAPILCLEKNIRNIMNYNENEKNVNFFYNGSYPLINYLVFGSKHLLKEIMPNRNYWFSSILCDFPSLECDGYYTLNLNSQFSQIIKIEAVKDGRRLAMISAVAR